MKKTVISAGKLARIIKLRRSGSSWLGIEQETSVPRRIAQKHYEEWERNKMGAELGEARIKIAEEEFRQHMEDLVDLARYMVDSLNTPAPIENIGNTEGFIERLLEGYVPGGKQPPTDKKNRLRLVRHNNMLFQSLQQHTRDKVPWQALQEWVGILESYRKHCQDLLSEAVEVTKGLVSHKGNMRERIISSHGGSEAIGRMSRGVVEALWRGILTGKPMEDSVFIGERQLDNRRTMISFGKEGSLMAFRVDDRKLAADIVEVCNSAARNLWQGKKSSLVKDIASDISTMDSKVTLLDGSIDELVLRPLILRSRCDYCPV